MTCASCSARVERALAKVDGVRSSIIAGAAMAFTSVSVVTNALLLRRWHPGAPGELRASAIYCVKLLPVPMKLRRTNRVVAALIAMFSLLFMQLAVAAYACPMLAQETPPPMTADCHNMDRENPVLCHAFVESGKQSLDKAAAPAVQPFVAAAALAEVAPVDQLAPAGALLAPSAVPAMGPAPPIAILHCCFRI